MNLTAITDEPSVYLKHFYDSISAAFYIDFKAKKRYVMSEQVQDFRVFHLKFVFHNLKVTIVDSLNKRIGFLRSFSRRIRARKCEFCTCRAEDFGQNKNTVKNLILLQLEQLHDFLYLSELCVPLVKKGGFSLQ